MRISYEIHSAIRLTGQDVLEGELDVAGIQRGGLDEGKVVLACLKSTLLVSRLEAHTGKLLGLFCWDSAEMSQIALVTDQHYDDVCVGVISQLLKPPSHIVVCLVLADVVNEQRTDRTAVVGRGNGSVAFLASRIPDLGLAWVSPP